MSYSILKGYFPFIVIMKYWLYSPWRTVHLWVYLISSSLYLPLLLLHPSFVPSHPPLLAMSLFSISVSLFLLYLLVCFIFYTTHVISYSICLSLSDISLSIIPSWFIRIVGNGRISSFITNIRGVWIYTHIYTHIYIYI